MGWRTLERSARRGRDTRVLSYCLYDFGNSAFATIIVTGVYSVYFRTQVAGSRASADLLWGLSISTAMILAALLTPVLGARADRFGTRHRFLAASTFLSIGATAALAAVGRGHVVAGMGLFVLAQAGYAIGEAFYNAFLPDVVEPERMGFVSGLAWGIGYMGGLLSLAGAGWLLRGAGDSAASTAPEYRALFLAVAGQYLLFTAPALLLLRDRRGPAPSGETAFGRLRRTASEIGRFRQVLRFLAAYFVYDNGISVVIAFTSIYMVTTLGFTMTQNLQMLAVLQITSAAGALVSGVWADRRGARWTVLASLVLWVAVLSGMAMVRSRAGFAVLALAGGLGIGSTQACSRTLLAHIVPSSKRAEFFGFFAFCTKASGMLGPPLFGLLSRWSGSQRLALLSVLFFFGAGLILLALVDEDEARRVAAEYREPAGEART